MKSLHALLVATAAMYALPSSSQTLFAVNQGDATVSVIDVAKGKTVATLDEGVQGVHAHEAVVSMDGKRLFLPVYGSAGVGKPGIDGHEMLVIDIASRKIVHRVEFGKGVRPHLPVMDERRNLLYVTTELNKEIAIVDPVSLKIVGSVPTGQEQSHMLVISHDGKRGYTSNVGPGSVSVLDLVARKTVKVIPVSSNVQRISISRDDKHVFTADQKKPQLAVIDTSSNEVSNYITLPDFAFGTSSTPDGKWLLAAIPTTNHVAVINMSTMKVVKGVAVDDKPQEIIFDPSGKTAYVSCMNAGTVDAIDLASWTVQKRIAAGPYADGLAITR